MKPFILSLLVSSTAVFAQAQMANTIVSPEVLPDHRVTFRISATNATQVTLFGDWMQASEVQAMTRDDKGVWSATAGPFPP
jgi:1,4-alpha-glucan branching enzyme